MAVADVFLMLKSMPYALAMLVCWLSAAHQAVDSVQLFLIMKIHLFPWHKRGNNNTKNDINKYRYRYRLSAKMLL